MYSDELPVTYHSSTLLEDQAPQPCHLYTKSELQIRIVTQVQKINTTRVNCTWTNFWFVMGKSVGVKPMVALP